MLRYAWLLLLLAPAARASYEPIFFAERVLKADIIAVGKIETLSGTSYGLRVERALAGCENGELLHVQRFTNWTCARRMRPYRKGERLVAILGKFKDGLAALGAACEGEVLLDRDGAHIVHPPGPDVVPEADVITAIQELRRGFDVERLLHSKSVTTLQATVTKLYLDGFDKPGLAAAHVGAFGRLLTHADATLRMNTAADLVQIVGAEPAAVLARRLAKTEQRDRSRLAIAIALCCARPKDAAAFDALLAVLERYDPPTKREVYGVQHVLYEVKPLGASVATLYPRAQRLLARELKRDIAHPLLIALRRWHGETDPLPYEQMPKERKRWLARTR